MSYFTDFVRGFLDLGATVILPVVIFLLGLFFRQKIGAAFRSGLTIGVAFVGIFLVIDLLVKNLGPAAQAMVKNLGVSLNVIDYRLASNIIYRLGIICRSIYYSTRNHS